MTKKNKNLIYKCLSCGFKDSDYFEGKKDCPSCGARYTNKINGVKYTINEMYSPENFENDIDSMID
jgi:ribosomal protein L37E